MTSRRKRKETALSEVVLVVGPGQIGQAIARRVGFGKHLLLADKRIENANAAAETLGNVGYDVSAHAVDISSRMDVEAIIAKATSIGTVAFLMDGGVTAAYWYGELAEVRS